MEKKIKVAPSLLSFDFNNLDKDIKRIIKAKADWLHLDIMDGVFVKNISFGLPVVKSIKEQKIFKDVHLMIVNPHLYADQFINCGSDLITFHLEAYKYKKDVLNLIKQIKKQNTFVGISIKPNTPVEAIYPYLSKIDLVLVMSVEPGFGGQKFIESSLEKIKNLRNYIDENKLDCLIEVDGGINEHTTKLVKNAGVDVVVAGSYLADENIKSKIKNMKNN